MMNSNHVLLNRTCSRPLSAWIVYT